MKQFIIVLILVMTLSVVALAENYAFIMGQKEISFVQYGTGPKTEVNPELRAYQARQQATKKVYMQYISWLKSLNFQEQSLGELMDQDPGLRQAIEKSFFLNSRLEDVQYPDGKVKVTLTVSWNRTPLALALDRLYRKRAFVVEKDGDVNWTVQWREGRMSLKEFEDAPADEGNSSMAKEYQGYTGIIIDTRGYHVRPSMAPKIYDKSGSEIYGTMDADPDYVIEVGIVGYAYSVEEAKEADRIGANPLVVQAVGRSGNAKDHAIIALDTADLIRELGLNSSILTECKVMFVID